jgi:hypothetical protein
MVYSTFNLPLKTTKFKMYNLDPDPHSFSKLDLDLQSLKKLD